VHFSKIVKMYVDFLKGKWIIYRQLIRKETASKRVQNNIRKN